VSSNLTAPTISFNSPAGRIHDRSADSHVRAFVPSDNVRADKAVRAPVSALLEAPCLSCPWPKKELQLRRGPGCICVVESGTMAIYSGLQRNNLFTQSL